jgi:hypothetical protein
MQERARSFSASLQLREVAMLQRTDESLDAEPIRLIANTPARRFASKVLIDLPYFGEIPVGSLTVKMAGTVQSPAMLFRIWCCQHREQIGQCIMIQRR